MGKKRAAAVSATAVPFSAPPAEPEQELDHFSDYGFDPQLHFFSLPEVKRLWGRRQRHHQPAQLKPLESARFKLQKPISKKHHHRPQKQHQQRRRWWSSAASAALHLFKKRPSSTSTRPAADTTHPYGSAAPTTVPLYLADYDAGDGGDDDGAAASTCWAPAVRSGRLAAAEVGVAALAVPYVSLRSTSLGSGGTGAGSAPVMPIYLVTPGCRLRPTRILRHSFPGFLLHKLGPDVIISITVSVN